MNWLKRLIGMQDKTTADLERIEKATGRIADAMEAAADEVERRFGPIATIASVEDSQPPAIVDETPKTNNRLNGRAKVKGEAK